MVSDRHLYVYTPNWCIYIQKGIPTVHDSGAVHCGVCQNQKMESYYLMKIRVILLWRDNTKTATVVVGDRKIAIDHEIPHVQLCRCIYM